MDSEHKVVVWVVGIAATGLVVLVGLWHWSCVSKVRYYTENGYTQTTLMGEDFAHWVLDPNTHKEGR